MCCYNSFRYGYTCSACSNSAQDFSVSPNVHSTLRSMNREGFSRRSSTVGTGFITTFKAKDLTLCLSTREHIKESCAENLDEAFCILKVTGVLIEKTLMNIFLKIQLIEVQPCADPESYVRGGPTLIFLVDEGREDQNTTIGGPIMAQH